MTVKVDRFWIVYESTSMQAIDPDYLCISEEDIREYMKEHPMPDDPHYSVEDLIGDLTMSAGFLTLPDSLKPETRQYVADLIQHLM